MVNPIDPVTPPASQWTSGFYLRALLLGFLPMVGLLTLMCGSLDAAMTILFWSVVCTLGIGALFWAGLAMLIGAALQVLVPPLRSRSPSRAAKRREGLSSVATDPHPLRSLINYAVLGLERGLSAERLSRDLLRAGWGETEVESAMGQARQWIAAAAAAPPATGPESRDDAR